MQVSVLAEVLCHSSDLSKGLEKLLNVSDADLDGFDRPLCLENTRVSVRDEILEWAHAKSDDNMFWVWGAAGSGKSTVAQTIADHLRKNGSVVHSNWISDQLIDIWEMARGALSLPQQSHTAALGCYQFYIKGKSNPKMVPRAVALKVSRSNPVVARCMLDAVEGADIASASVKTQFEILFCKALAKAVGRIRGSIVIILDALDDSVLPRNGRG